MLTLLLATTLFGCDFAVDQTVDVTLDLPALPDAWRPFSGAVYRLSWTGPAGAGAPSSGAAPGSSGFSPGTRVVVALPRSVPIAVLATPDVAGALLAPAGAIWPLQLTDDNVLPLRFAEGPAATVLTLARERGADLEHFAVSRLAATIRAQLPDDPWQLDVARLAQKIAERGMRESYIRAAERYPVGAAPPSGTWYGYSPFAAPVTPETGWPPLSVGVHRFGSADGRRIYVEMDGEGRAWVLGP